VSTETGTGAGSPVGLLLCRDLFFTSKVTGTAQALGARVLVAGQLERAASLITEKNPRVVFVDLAAEDLASSESLRSLQKFAAPGTQFVAFGSHVDAVALEAARAAGCEPVLPRSRFTTDLPELIRRYLG
jgi:DNA-binding NarL/FixJ family response regulator